jgi:hypothetical protein
MGAMLTVLTLFKIRASRDGWKHGERPFWKSLGRQYLDAWLAGVRRFVPEPKRVVIMTDAPELVPDAPVVGLDRRIDAPGFWAKLNMFREGVSEGRCLYMDLDNIITGPLDELCALAPDPLIMLDDRRIPRLPNGSMILFDAARCRTIWDRYVDAARHIERAFVAEGEDYSRAYDQAFIAYCMGTEGVTVPFFQDLLPRGYVLNAVSELPQAEDWKDARVIFGSGLGEGKPHTASHPAFRLPGGEFTA